MLCAVVRACTHTPWSGWPDPGKEPRAVNSCLPPSLLQVGIGVRLRRLQAGSLARQITYAI
jgi:hypothetical protein